MGQLKLSINSVPEKQTYVTYFEFISYNNYVLWDKLNRQVSSFPNQVNLSQPRSICFKLDQLVLVSGFPYVRRARCC